MRVVRMCMMLWESHFDQNSNTGREEMDGNIKHNLLFALQGGRLVSPTRSSFSLPTLKGESQVMLDVGE